MLLGNTVNSANQRKQGGNERKRNRKEEGVTAVILASLANNGVNGAKNFFNPPVEARGRGLGRQAPLFVQLRGTICTLGKMRHQYSSPRDPTNLEIFFVFFFMKGRTLKLFHVGLAAKTI